MGRANSAWAVSGLAVPLFGILSARAPDPFSKRAGDLSALRKDAVSCGLGVLFFRAAGGVGCASLWVVGWVAKGYPSPASRELPSAEGSQGVARSASSSLRREAESWWIAKGRFSLGGCSRLGFLKNGLVLFEGKVPLGFASRQGGRKGARLVHTSSFSGDTHRVPRVWARSPSAGRGRREKSREGHLRWANIPVQ